MAVINLQLTDRLLLGDAASASKRTRMATDILRLDEMVLVQAIRPFVSYELHPHAKARDVLWVDATVAGNVPWGGS